MTKRERMITRTVDITTAEYMSLDVTTAEVKVQYIELSGNYNTKEALKVVQEMLQTETLKIVHVTSVSHTEVLYGMTEEKFIEVAKVLPPRKASVI